MSVSTARDTVRVGPVEVDRAPVTNARYAAFVEATSHRPPAYWPRGSFPRSVADHPVVGVDFFDAIAFARWAGGSLPTEAEWVSASGLTEHRAYPWGDRFDASSCNTVRSGVKGTTPVGQYAPAPSGCVDLCGNVWEMTCNAYPEDDQAVIVKGGSWYDFPGHAKLDTRFAARVQKGSATIGFRLVYGRRLRLPSFLDEDLVASCIEWRRADPSAAAPPADTSEFTAVMAQLRSEAEVALPGIGQDSPDLDARAVDEALELFDAIELGPLDLGDGREPKANADAPIRPTLVERMQTLVSEHPRALWVVLAAALLLAVLLVVSAADGGATTRRSHVPYAYDGGPAPRLATPNRVRAATRTEPVRGSNSRGNPLEDAIQRLSSGTAAQREEAERYLIEHPDEARTRVQKALTEERSERALASLRYVLVALGEQAELRPSRSRVTTTPPREGLVVFFDRMDGEISEEIAKVRRTAAAEGRPVTAVYTGEASGRMVLRTYASILRDVQLYVDRDRTLTQLWGATTTPTVAGLNRGGHLAFVHRGRMQRSTLARKVAELN